MIRRLAILLLVCGGLGFFLQREQSRGTFDAWERLWLAQVRRAEGPRPPAPPVVLIELRRGDLPFESWPPAPLDYALVFESLVRRQPRQVVVQPLLAWPGVEPLDAATLAERIALLPRGVLACTLQRGLDDLPGAPASAVPLPVLPGASGDVSKVPDFAALGQVPIEELRMGKTLGFTRIEFGEGVSVHGDAVALPLLARRGGELVPSLALQALLVWQQAAPGDVMIQLGRRLTLGGSVEIPIDAAGRLRLSARLAPPLNRLDAGTLLIDLERDAKLLAERSAELEILRSLDGALVVLGETGETTPRFQVSGAPEGGWTEAEVLARSLVASLSGFHLREPAPRWLWAGWAVVVFAGAALLGCPRRWVPVFALGGATAMALGFALAFLNGQWWIPPVPPLSLWLAASTVAFILPPPRATATSGPASTTETANPPASATAGASADAVEEAAATRIPAADRGTEPLPATAVETLSAGQPAAAPPPPAVDVAASPSVLAPPATEPGADPPQVEAGPLRSSSAQPEDAALEALAHELAQDELAQDEQARDKPAQAEAVQGERVHGEAVHEEAVHGEAVHEERAGAAAGREAEAAGGGDGSVAEEAALAGASAPISPEVRAAAKPIKPGRKGHRSGKGRSLGGGGGRGEDR
jgi:hypothetical protein